MSARIAGYAADAVLLVHLLFILFVLLGGLLTFKWRRVMYLHLPSVLWGVAAELAGWICPLTPLENMLRYAAGEPGYGGSFISHYLLPLIYPAGLTRALQIALGGGVLLLNTLVYALRFHYRRRPD